MEGSHPPFLRNVCHSFGPNCYFWTPIVDHVLLFSDQAVTFGQNTDSRNLGLAVHQHTELFLDPFLCLFAPFKTNKQTLYVLAFLFPLVALPVQYFSGTRLWHFVIFCTLPLCSKFDPSICSQFNLCSNCSQMLSPLLNCSPVSRSKKALSSKYSVSWRVATKIHQL